MGVAELGPELEVAWLLGLVDASLPPAHRSNKTRTNCCFNDADFIFDLEEGHLQLSRPSSDDDTHDWHVHPHVLGAQSFRNTPSSQQEL